MPADAPHNRERQSDLAVMDANEYKQKRRLERILDAMDNIPDQNDIAKGLYSEGDIDEHGWRIRLKDAVDVAIWEAWNLLKIHDKNSMQKAEESDEDIYPRSEYFYGSNGRGPIGQIEQQRNEDIEIWGLKEFFETDEIWLERWEETERPRNQDIQTTVKEQVHTVPRDVSWNAALRLKEFLNDEHDMDITFEAIEKEVHADPF